VRVITIDETLSSPHVQFRYARGSMLPDLIGAIGQTCAVSFSSDLINWSTPQVFTLEGPRRALEAIGQTIPGNIFYRVTQSYPLPPPSPPPTGYDGGGVVIQSIIGGRVGHTFTPPPPVPGL